jgi:hypothetical protein
MPQLLKLYRFILLVTVSLSLAFCNDETDSMEQDSYAAKFIFRLNPSDTFQFFLPEKDSSLLELKREHDSLLKLPSLENGFDSLQLRIAFGCFLGVDFLVILSNSNQKWSGELSKLQYHTDSLDNRSITRKSIRGNPKSGWKNLIRKLFELKILTLPDDDDIPALIKEHPSDGCGVAVEIATNKVYKVYNYENPNIYTKTNWQAENIMKIIRLLANEFDLEKRFKIKDEFMWPD